MKFLVISAVLLYVSVAAANVVVNQVNNVEEPAPVVVEAEAERQSEVAAVPTAVEEGITEPSKTCNNVTVSTTDCTAIIVTRLPFLFNFRMLNNVCTCDNRQLKCQGAGRNFFERLQIPAMRTVYNLNCKCKCPSLVDSILPETTTTVPV